MGAPVPKLIVPDLQIISDQTGSGSTTLKFTKFIRVIYYTVPTVGTYLSTVGTGTVPVDTTISYGTRYRTYVSMVRYLPYRISGCDTSKGRQKCKVYLDGEERYAGPLVPKSEVDALLVHLHGPGLRVDDHLVVALESALVSGNPTGKEIFHLDMNPGYQSKYLRHN